MIEPWLPLLEKLPLSRTEREVVKRFRADPDGRAFLPVADILRAHRKVDESLELLVQGVNRHPRFTVARVVLARELFRKGMVLESWQCLQDSPISLDENVLAQKLQYKMAILLRDETAVLRLQRHMDAFKMMDNETKRLADLLAISGLDRCREELVRELVQQGIPLESLAPSTAPPRLMAPSASQPQAPADEEAPAASRWEDRVAGFHVVPLGEVFRPRDSRDTAGGPVDDAVELDSTTLAEIYARQGHYGKALGVYRRLVRLNPNNDLLRRKLAELTRLERAQQDERVEVDPAVVDQMEQLEIIDTQLRYLNGILERLS